VTKGSIMSNIRTLAALSLSTTAKDKATWQAMQVLMTEEQAAQVAEAVAEIVAEENDSKVKACLTGGAEEVPEEVVAEANALMQRAAEILLAHAPRNPRNSTTWDGYVMRAASPGGAVKVTLTV
jgi:endonuclease III